MKLERERYGWSTKEAASKAKWSTDIWKQLELHEMPIEPHHWINICAVFELNDERLARRMDAFVRKNPVMLVGMSEDETLDIFEKKLTSPRLLQSKRVFTLSLSPVREELFNILSLYVADAESLIDMAQKKGFYLNTPEPPLKPSFRLKNTDEKREDRRIRLARFITEKIDDGKLEAVETALKLIAGGEQEEIYRAVQVIALMLKS
ncbi:MAG: hypothetical protein JXX14_15490 [Deltaproteobacteria bacterium]|nr:hypothetical protein [Deltaproteobacteria bacterium]